MIQLRHVPDACLAVKARAALCGVCRSPIISFAKSARKIAAQTTPRKCRERLSHGEPYRGKSYRMTCSARKRDNRFDRARRLALLEILLRTSLRRD